MELVHIDITEDDSSEELSDALFWADYLIDDDSDVAPLVMEDKSDEQADTV
jgi:hypothetical protein